MNSSSLRPRLAGVDREDRHVVDATVFLQRLEVRHLRQAAAAPRRPEIHDRRPPAQIAQPHALTLRRRNLEVRRILPDVQPHAPARHGLQQLCPLNAGLSLVADDEEIRRHQHRSQDDCAGDQTRKGSRMRDIAIHDGIRASVTTRRRGAWPCAPTPSLSSVEPSGSPSP